MNRERETIIILIFHNTQEFLNTKKKILLNFCNNKTIIQFP